MRDFQKKGWVRLYRTIEDSDLWLLEPFTRGQAWVDLFLMANHRKKKLLIRGNYIEVDRGQIAWSEVTMAKRWSWSRNKVRRFLKVLETEQQIEQQKSNVTTIITIVNYEKYQTEKTADETAERQQKDSRRYTNKNVKNVKNENNILSKDSSDVSVNDLIDLFKHVNPSYKKLFANKTQRACLERMIQEHGAEKIHRAIKVLPDVINRKYAPTITTPHQLESKLGQLIAYLNKERQNVKNSSVKKI